MKRKTAVCLVLLLSLFSLAGCGKENTKIGFAGCLTGTNSELGVSGMYGALLAVEDINQAGGIKGKKLELITKDDHGDSEAALKADKELAQEGCVAVIGHMTSDMAELTVPYINEKRMLMISPTIALPSLSDVDDYFFRLIPSTQEQSERIAEEIRKQNVKKVQIIYSEQNTVFANSINACLIENLSGHNVGMELLGAVGVKDNPDYEEKINAIKESDADALVIIASADIVAGFAQSLHRVKADKTVFLPAWSMTNDLIQRGGPAVEGYYGVNFIDYDSRSEDYIRFREKYVQKYGEEPTFASILSYESVTVLTAAMKEAAGYRGDDLKAAILAIEKFHGLQGELSLNRFGDIDRECYLYQIRDGKFVKTEGES